MSPFCSHLGRFCSHSFAGWGRFLTSRKSLRSLDRTNLLSFPNWSDHSRLFSERLSPAGPPDVGSDNSDSDMSISPVAKENFHSLSEYSSEFFSRVSRHYLWLYGVSVGVVCVSVHRLLI